MKLKNRTTSTVTEDTFTIDVNGKIIVYKEFLNNKGKVIDLELRNEDGQLIENAQLLEDIQEFTDKQ